ncbi:MAG: IS607 family transposase [Candidatus Hermodarchaeota archaeon]
MKYYVAIGEASKLLGVCIKTLRSWNKDGKIHCYRTPGGHRRFAMIEIERIISEGLTEEVEDLDESEPLYGSKTAIYARVSSHDQKKKGDVDRQIEVAKEYCEARGALHPRVFKDISSGLNTKRPGLLKLYEAIERKEVERVICTYPDRLTRFRLSYLIYYFGSHGATVEMMEQPPTQSMEEELVQDMVAIITSFSGRVPGLRSAKKRRKHQTGHKIQEAKEMTARGILFARA